MQLQVQGSLALLGAYRELGKGRKNSPLEVSEGAWPVNTETGPSGEINFVVKPLSLW